MHASKQTKGQFFINFSGLFMLSYFEFSRREKLLCVE